MMHAAMRQILAVEPSIKIVGEAELPGSPEAIQMMTDIKPEVYYSIWSCRRNVNSDFMTSQLRIVPHTLVLSLSNDTEAQALPARYGAHASLHKRNLSGNMIPAIMNCCVHGAVSKASPPHAA
jgi:DNA-binding NarL/FixJ family response regulator